ncbi:hypothetical protein CEV31_0369 [Brucella thiophenivorans]|uniref:Uncharacterized protein n=1 Tax=Brucella thiophenivorans TaxID=571255 RepID=A0A256G4J1_9HYPH|nr:hypothetical protein CEV31_0369 [Brucella thiophenivorans]
MQTLEIADFRFEKSKHGTLQQFPKRGLGDLRTLLFLLS